jgi:hypothetical protein
VEVNSVYRFISGQPCSAGTRFGVLKGVADMQNVDIIVLGGSAAGVTAAITAKRHYPSKLASSSRMR